MGGYNQSILYCGYIPYHEVWGYKQSILYCGYPPYHEVWGYNQSILYCGSTRYQSPIYVYLDRTNDCLYFGDEVEYTLVKFDSESNKVTVSLKAQHYLQVLENLDKEGKVRSENNFT